MSLYSVVRNKFSAFFKPAGTTAVDTARNFSLDSGERQTGRTLDAIRRDHLLRYEYASRVLLEKFGHDRNLFGLDIFCATGYGTRLLADSLGGHLLGIDASKEAIMVANEHFSNDRTFFVSKIFPFSLPIETFDFIVCYESVEHVDYYDLFIETVCRSLKHGGVLLVSTPNDQFWSLELNPNPFHFKHFTRTEIVRAVERCSGMSLQDWCGQNIYRFDNGMIADVLPEDLMNILPQVDGQIHLTFYAKHLRGA